MNVSLSPFAIFLVGLVAGCQTAATAPAVPVAAPTLYAGPFGNEPLVVGNPAPDFSAAGHNGEGVRLSALRGKEVVLFFYSMDDTPRSTQEASAFRDAWEALGRRGVEVIGISTDTIEAHRQFARHLRLPYPLISDQAGSIAHAYGVANSYGVLDYNTVLIDRDGTVKKIYRSVQPTKHASQVLVDLNPAEVRADVSGNRDVGTD